MFPNRPTIATLTAHAAQALQRNRLLSAAGYRVITPKSPDDILTLLASQPAVALVVNNSVELAHRQTLLQSVRHANPDLLIIHVYTRGEQQVEPSADLNVDVTDPTRLVVALEERLNSRYEDDSKRA